MVRILTYPICESYYGGVWPALVDNAENALNDLLHDLEKDHCVITNVKVNHFTVKQNLNGNYDEVWVQYTVFYDESEKFDESF